jgi:hypothetical protein
VIDRVGEIVETDGQTPAGVAIGNQGIEDRHFTSRLLVVVCV